MSSLKLKLKDLLHEKKISVAEIERKAGLKVSAVRNILSGQSKNPSAETLRAISRALGCSMEELMDETTEEVPVNMSANNADRKAPVVTDFKFLQKTTDFVNRIVEDNYIDKNFTLIDMAHFYREIYLYSLKNSYPDIDEKFADWVITQRLEDLQG